MHDVARAVAEDRVILVLAIDGEAARAALLQAVELLVAEVPAARPLREVPADGADVADLRRADFAGGVGERGKQLRAPRDARRDPRARTAAPMRSPPSGAAAIAASSPFTFTTRSGCAM